MDAASVCDFQPASFWVLQFTLSFGFSPYPGIAGLLYTKVYWELAFCSYQTGKQLQAGPAALVAWRRLPGCSLDSCLGGAADTH